MKVKIQVDLTGTLVLITDANTGQILWEAGGAEAQGIRNSYNLKPFTKTTVHGHVDGTGMLHLGHRVQ